MNFLKNQQEWIESQLVAWKRLIGSILRTPQRTQAVMRPQWKVKLSGFPYYLHVPLKMVKADQNQKLLLDCYGYLLGLLKILKVHAHYYLIDVKLYFHASSCSSANALRNQVSSSSEVGRMQTH